MTVFDLVRNVVPDGRVLAEYGADANDVHAEFIWMSPAVGDSGLFGGDDGLGGYMPLSVAADDNGGVSQLSWVYGNHMGLPADYTDAGGTKIPIPTGYSAWNAAGYLMRCLNLCDLCEL